MGGWDWDGTLSWIENRSLIEHWFSGGVLWVEDCRAWGSLVTVLWFGAWGLGLGVWGSGIRVQSLSLRFRV